MAEHSTAGVRCFKFQFWRATTSEDLVAILPKLKFEAPDPLVAPWAKQLHGYRVSNFVFRFSPLPLGVGPVGRKSLADQDQQQSPNDISPELVRPLAARRRP